MGSIKSPTSGRLTALIAGLLVLLFVAACGGAEDSNPVPTDDNSQTEVAQAPTEFPTPFTLITPAPTPTPVTPTPVPPTPFVELHTMSDASWAMDRLLEDESGLYGVVMMQPDGTINYVRNSRVPFLSASLYKLVLLADIFRKVESGQLSLDQEIMIDSSDIPANSDYFAFKEPTSVSLERALFATGAFSSNVAAQELLKLTTLDSLGETIRMIGLIQTEIQASSENLYNWPPPVLDDSTEEATEEGVDKVMQAVADEPTSITTPMDMAIYLQKMYQDALISPYISQSIEDILLQQAINDRIPELLPADTVIAHKTGNLDGIIHDVGTIETPQGTVILAALSENVPNETRAEQVIQRLALIAYGDYKVPPFTGDALKTPKTGATPDDSDDEDDD